MKENAEKELQRESKESWLFPNARNSEELIKQLTEAFEEEEEDGLIIEDSSTVKMENEKKEEILIEMAKMK